MKPPAPKKFSLDLGNLNNLDINIGFKSEKIP